MEVIREGIDLLGIDESFEEDPTLLTPRVDLRIRSSA